MLGLETPPHRASALAPALIPPCRRYIINMQRREHVLSSQIRLHGRQVRRPITAACRITVPPANVVHVDAPLVLGPRRILGESEDVTQDLLALARFHVRCTAGFEARGAHGLLSLEDSGGRSVGGDETVGVGVGVV